MTAADTGGEAVVLESHLGPHGRGVDLHAHPAQEERIQVVRGALGVLVGRRQIVLERGQRTTIAAGSPHTYWNAGIEPVCFVAEIRPALQFESFLETLFDQKGATRCFEGSDTRR